MFGKTSLDSEKDNVGTSVCGEELGGGVVRTQRTTPGSATDRIHDATLHH